MTGTSTTKPLLCILAFALLPIAGCTGGTPVNNTIDTATVVTLDQLEQETAHLPIIHYLGSDAHYHFIRGDERSYFRLLRSGDVPDFPVLDDPDVPIGSFGLFMAIHDGKLTTPTPSDLAAAGYDVDSQP